MSRKTRRAVALATAAMLAATFFGTGFTGATAQDQVGLEQLETVIADAELDNPEAQLRFVSNPVVQELPGEDSAFVSTGDAASLAELVSSMPEAGELSADLQCLAEAVYFESRGEPLSGQLAVARVVINRAESELFPDDYCSVVTQRAQFSFVRGGQIPTPNTSSAAWHRAHAIARIAHQELWVSEAADSLYFHATYVSPRWARTKSTRAQISSHIFYR